MDKFKEKVVLITGGTSGIGRSVAKFFALEGAAVCLVGRSLERGESIMEEINSRAGKSVFFRADITKCDDCKKVVNNTIDQFGKIDILYNNAGFEGSLKKIQDTSIEEWDEVINLHLRATFLLSKLSIPHMIKNKYGVIMNNSSEIGLNFIHTTNYVPYATSRAAVIAFSKALAVEVAEFGIRVNVVCPGAIDTPMLDREIERWLSMGLYKNKNDAIKSIKSRNPLKEIGTSADVVNAVLFLASDRAKYITGVAIPIDGGGSV